MTEEATKKQHTIEYIAMGVLVVVALVIGMKRFQKGSNNDEVFSRKEFNKKWEEVVILEAGVPKKEKEIAYTEGDDTLVFKSPIDDGAQKNENTEEIVTLPDMKYQGMVWKSSRPQAIINNKVYDIKDVIKADSETGGSDILVNDIAKDGIHLIYKNKEFIVRPK